MKLLIQWSLSHPQSWTEIDSSEWTALPKKPVPSGGEVIDDEPGWIRDVCIQGITFSPSDHVAIETIGDNVKVTSWCDDPNDYEPAKFYARVTVIHPVRPDPKLGGALNTHIETVLYAGKDELERLKNLNISDAELKSWDKFVKPPENITRHGIWLDDKLFEKHAALAQPVSWREWGLNGSVPSQRDLGLYAKARGTITWYQRGTNGGGGSGDDADHAVITGGLGGNFYLTKNSTTYAVVSRGVPKAAVDELSFTFTTSGTEPAQATWPVGDYRAQIDISAIDSASTVKLKLLRVGFDGGIKETIGTSTAHSTAGLFLFTETSWGPDTDASTDMYQVRVLVTNGNIHATKTFSTDVRHTDAFADGPWVEVGPETTSGSCDARTLGKVVDALSSKNARTKGQITDLSSYGARTLGTIIVADSCDARILGNATKSDAYDARVAGNATSLDSRNARIVGASIESNARGARIVGKVISSDNRSARIIGDVGVFDNRDARTKGQVTTADGYDARIKGQVTNANTYGARTKGQITDADGYDARTLGQVTNLDTYDARTKGQVTTANVQAARTKGIVEGLTSARSAATKGWAESEPGTFTKYYQRGTFGGGGSDEDADHACNPGVFGFKLSKEYSSQVQVVDTVPGTTNGRISYTWTTSGNLGYPEPPIPWPSGDYTAQVDVVSLNPDMYFKIQLLRIKISSCDVLETLGTSAYFNNPGLHKFTVTGYDPGDTGRFQVRVICDNSGGTPGNIRFNIRGTNSYAEGPWYYTSTGGRSARTLGVATDTSSINARIEGSDEGTTDSGSRNARTIGQVTTYGNKSARIKGFVTTANAYSARTLGYVTTPDERDARIKGLDNISSVKNARTLGYTTGIGTDERNARTAGRTVTADNRSARIVGGNTNSNSQGARTKGLATTLDVINARTEGYAVNLENRDARTKGSIVDRDTRSARIKGLVVTPSVRNARTLGEAPGWTSASGDIGATTRGLDTTTALRNARVLGNTEIFELRNARVVGSVTSANYISARALGFTSTNEARNSRIIGKVTETSSKSARTSGKLGSSTNKLARILGVDTQSDTKLARTIGAVIKTTTSTKNARIVGIGAVFSSRGARIKGLEEDSRGRKRRIDDALAAHIESLISSYGYTNINVQLYYPDPVDLGALPQIALERMTSSREKFEMGSSRYTEEMTYYISVLARMRGECQDIADVLVRDMNDVYITINYGSERVFVTKPTHVDTYEERNVAESNIRMRVVIDV